MTEALTVDMRQEPGRVRITLLGRLTPEAGRGQYERVIRQAEAGGIHRILLDARGLLGRESIPDIFEFMLHTYPDQPGGRRTACLDLPAHQVSARFFEHLMQNNGRCFRLFFDEAEALRWLDSEQP